MRSGSASLLRVIPTVALQPHPSQTLQLPELARMPLRAAVRAGQVVHHVTGVPVARTCTSSCMSSPRQSRSTTAWSISVATRGDYRRRLRGLAMVAAARSHAPSKEQVLAEQCRVAGAGDEVLVHYTGYLEDGSIFDSTGSRGEPFAFTLGDGAVVLGFEDAVRGLSPGSRVTVTLPPERAYGEHKSDLIFRVPAERVTRGLTEGAQVMVGSSGGRRLLAVVTKLDSDGSVTLDANTRLAGKTLVFDIELVGFKEATRRGMEVAGWRRSRVRVAHAIADSPVTQVLQRPSWPVAWPYSQSDFSRIDESDDGRFYAEPRLVTHIDERAIGAIRAFYAAHFAMAPAGEFSILDICSSWISHYPEDLRAGRVAITGMEESELSVNRQATEHVVRDLNVDPRLPYGDSEFDFVTNVVSVDYLIAPREVFAEMHRVLKPGGVAIVSFSNRCFHTKAIAMWVADMNDGPGHCQIVGNYFYFNPGRGAWHDITSVDISPDPSRSDPVWVVTAVKPE